MSAVRRERKLRVTLPVYDGLRLTIPAKEALEKAGNRITETATSTGTRYAVEVSRPPYGIVMCLIGQGNDQHHGLRLENEPAYPGEWPESAVAWYERGEWVPCPQCGAALVWFEAGYVPGYRICTVGHHVQLSEDGRTASAVRM